MSSETISSSLARAYFLGSWQEQGRSRSRAGWHMSGVGWGAGGGHVPKNMGMCTGHEQQLHDAGMRLGPPQW